jgi:Tol biopolymer transport system component/C-terminal processing protease CtpA/Prc
MTRILRAALVVLSCAAGAAGLARPAGADAPDSSTRGLRFPTLSPDGKTVAFAWRGDLWRAPVAGGPATRLTLHEAQDTKPRFSPDGTQIAFTSRRTGNYDVFVMPAEGGQPKQVTFHSAADLAVDWSPDGKRILFASTRDGEPNGMDLYEVDVAGGTPRRVTRDGAREGSYSPDGTQVVYVRGFNTVWQDDYKGSANYDLYVTDLAGGAPRRLTKTEGNELNPSWSADGKTIYFLAETKGAWNFSSVPAAGGETKALTTWKDNARRCCAGWDRKTLAFEKEGRLYTIDATSATPTPVEIAVSVRTDDRNSGVETRTLTQGGEHVAISPDGANAAVSVRGDIWVMPAAGGEATRLTTGPAKDEWPRWSPDGKKIAYVSDARGSSDVWLIDLATKESKPLTTNAALDSFHSWAPDGKRLVFTSDRTGNKDLFLLDLESGEEKQLTRDPKDDDDAVFSSDGRWIAFDSTRGGTPGIYVMPAGGPESQARRVSPASGTYQVPSFSPDGSMVAFEEFDPAGTSPGGIYATKTGGGPSVQLSRDGTGACWSPRGDWIYFTAERGDDGGIYRVRAPSSIEAGERVPFLGRVQVDRRREFGDLFDEAWLLLRKGFYDAKMHGVDWDAIKAKYRPLAVDAEIQDEFYNVVSQMLGELHASHLGIYAGKDADGDASGGAPPTGYLGLELEAKAAEGGGRRVATVQPGGPAFEAGLRVGDVVRSVNGVAIEPSTDLDRALAGAAGREVKVAYALGDGSGDKTQTIKAASARQMGELHYRLWVEKNAKAVKDKTGGAAGYLHLSGMDAANLAKFNAALGELNARKAKGLVLDVRNNGGGNIHQQLIEALAAKPYIAFQPQAGTRQVQPTLYWGKPVVLLINERSFSDAEVFPYAFKQMRLGKVVGVPTAGGVIGTTDVTLSDGSRFRIPRIGWFGLNGENLEHLGVKPDVLVEETSEDRLSGRDPQLEKAIALLDAEIRPAGSPPPAAPEATTPTPDPKDPTAASTTPAAPAPARKGGDDDPLADAATGETARYDVPTKDGAQTLTLRVAAVDATSVTIVGEPAELFATLRLPTSVPRMPLETAFEKQVVGSLGRLTATRSEDVTTPGFSGPARVFELTDADGTVLTLSFSNRVPVLGLVRASRGGQVLMQVTGFEAKPASPESGAGNAPPATPVHHKPQWHGPSHDAPPPPPEVGTPTAPAASPDEVENPLFDAKVGEWMRMRRRARGGETTATVRVAEVTDAEVVIETEVDGLPARGPGQNDSRLPRTKALSLREGQTRDPAKDVRETITLNGTTLHCVVVTVETPRGVERRWVTNEVPCTGVVRVERGGVVISEALEWGTSPK